MNNPASPKMLPCPFCGDEAFLYKEGGNKLRDGTTIAYRIACQGKCHAMTCYWHTEEECIDAWNARAAPIEAIDDDKDDLSIAYMLGVEKERDRWRDIIALLGPLVEAKIFPDNKIWESTNGDVWYDGRYFDSDGNVQGGQELIAQSSPDNAAFIALAANTAAQIRDLLKGME